MELPDDRIAVSPRMDTDPSEPLGDALRRVMLEQLAVGRDGFSLPEADAELDSKVHLARKAFKRTRAALRLVRDEIGRPEYRAANVTVRDQSRKLSELRSARVLAMTLDSLMVAAPEMLAPDEVDTLRAELSTRRAELVANLRSSPAVISAAISNVDAVERQICQWHLGDDFAAIVPSLERVYRRGRKALDAAGNGGTTHAFHDWRKRVNYLRYQIELISGRLSGTPTLENEFNVLSELLGDEHDLAEFAQLLAADTALVPSADVRSEVLAEIDRSRSRLQQDALAMGTSLYADKPSRFVGRLESAWVE
ncbi:MAG: CHAD domain-containing protein [bacterium]|nr:CHAD domain-containing protein [bacterium]